MACTPREGVELLVLGGRVERSADIPYGREPRQQLDVYRDRGSGGHAPVVVFIHGGRWKYSSKRDYLLMGNALAREGWVVVVPNYRLFPAATYPAWVVDGATAVRWARDHAAEFGGDPARLVVIGHSAGAHTVTMLALDRRFLRQAGVPDGAVRGFVSIAGPVDTTWTDPDVQALMGPADGWPETYPRTFVDGTAPPLLLLHGLSDDVVSASNSERLAARIRVRGGCTRLIEYEGLGHVQIALALAFGGGGRRSVRQDVESLVRDPAGFTCG